MAVFSYKAVNGPDVADGTVTADSLRQARDLLRDRGLRLVAIEPVREKPRLFAPSGARSPSQVIEFLRQLATLLSAGIPLLKALQTLAREHRGFFKTMLQQMADQIASGASLSDAMAVHPAFFNEMDVSIVRVGENAGSLEMALGRLVSFKESAHRLTSRLATALIYPAVVCLVGLAVAVFLMTFVLPNVLNTLLQSGKSLPPLTLAVKALSDLLIHWWWALLAALALAATAFRLFIHGDRGRLLFHRLLLRLPLFGQLIRKENTARMAVMLSELLKSGLQFVDAVRITRQTLRNRVFQKAMDDYAAAVTAGRDVAAPLEASGVFSASVVQMLAVGQQSGQIEEMLSHVAEGLNQQVNLTLQRLTAALEPLLIVILAIFVGLIAFATILPIMEVSNVL